ncbi:MAG: S-methyl-5-thioribose-1-phosphate isomerase [Spirochaetes bacterium]|nr:S-methyl-5-thioribose-1-phosphate isomerase [Spirochaetota bacterium]
MFTVNSIKWENESVIILDQSQLPSKAVYHTYSNYRDIINAICDLTINGNICIALSAAMGMALAVSKTGDDENKEEFFLQTARILDIFEKTRPSHFSLRVVITKFRQFLETAPDIKTLKYNIRNESKNFFNADMDCNKKIVDCGNEIIEEGDSILLYSNYGRFSSAGYGTVLGIIRKARTDGKNFRIYIGETRPELIGGRITAWELKNEGFDVTVIPDNHMYSLVESRKVNKIIFGAIHVSANGDVLTETGSKPAAAAAQKVGIPFYICASSLYNFDFNSADGSGFIYENRPVGEVAYIENKIIVPEGITILNSIFEKIESALITKIICDKGIEENPGANGISKFR